MSTVRFTYKDGKNKTLTMSYDDGVKQDRRLYRNIQQIRHKGQLSFKRRSPWPS